LTTAINLQRNSYKFISHLEHSDRLLAKIIW
jgi:hypothetical protein